MKGLNKFEKFDLPAFLEGKKLLCTGCRPWLDDDQKEIGKKVDLVIVEDKTEYPASKDGRAITNIYEKFTVKVRKNIDVPVEAIVAIVNGVGVVYGDYRNQLSVTADDVKVIAPPAAGQKEG